MGWSPAGRSLALRSMWGADRSAIAPTNLYVALYSGDPQGAGVEPTATGGYARPAALNDSTLWGTISPGATSITTIADITWPTSSGVWSITTPLTHWAILDNTAGGTIICSGQLTTPITITGAGDTARIPAGSLTIMQEA